MIITPFTRHVTSEAETAECAKRLADQLRAQDILLLQGDLGAGKTHFARAVIRHLMGSDITVPSPTFSLVQTYQLPNNITLWHFDLYRIKHPDEIWELGLEEAINSGISLIEWPENMGVNMGRFLPKKTLLLTITTPHETSPTSRLINLTHTGQK
ncbi:MAG: tRNA (adenosine(37)-N6)-threonylcarbamoyltransferase complex ATPase subunit type 1 TsaE [Alphaproteobacteria bacterium]|nr:tRNA (adenosine(37)-N6)-threonylcarbamoyltransferase complex ATPase subunit type 1 TsaE [Alphaproteobacteria bacterium]